MSSVTRPSPKTIRLVAYVVILVVAIWACIRLLSHATSETTNDAYVMADFTLVAPCIAGQISEVLVEDNQQVKAGQLLVRIDDRDFKAALMSAEADVAAEKASVANYEAEIARQPSLVDQARATLKSDDASIAFARQNASRYQNLSESGAGTAQEQQHSASALGRAARAAGPRSAALSTTEQNLAVSEYRAQQGGRGALARAEAVLDRQSSTCPIRRFPRRSTARLDQRRRGSAHSLRQARRCSRSSRLSEAYLSPTSRKTSSPICAGTSTVRIKVDTFPGVVIKGHVDSLAPATGLSFSPIEPDNATGNFTKVVQRVPVKITIDKGQEAASRLSVGLSVETEVAVGKRADTRVAGADAKMNASEFSICTSALAVSLCFALNGCLVGPDFERPQTSTPDVFNRTQAAQAPSRAVESEFSENGGRCSMTRCWTRWNSN